MSYIVELLVDDDIHQVTVNAESVDGLREMLDKLIEATYCDGSVTTVDIERIYVRIW